MYKKTMKFVDFDGNERTEDFYFNLTEAEVIEMERMTEKKKAQEREENEGHNV